MHAARSTQHAARSTQHAARSTQHAARSTQHAARSTQHAARNARWALTAAVTVIALGCGRSPEPEKPGVNQAPVAGGSVDVAGKFEAVAQVNVAGKGNCSGTLVTPLFVLTANHCVTGTLRDGIECAAATGSKLGDLSADATVRFFKSFDGKYVSSPPAAVAMHTFSKSKALLVRSKVTENFGEAMDLCIESESARDVALIRLDNDQRIPTGLIKPLNPPILGNPDLTWSPSCTSGKDSSDFTATVVGYGHTGWAFDFNPFNGDFDVAFENGNDGRERVFGQSQDWYREDGLVSNDWFALNYGGSLGGDSGGATIGYGKLCGVNSRHVPNILSDFDLVSVTQDSADVESNENQKFLQDNILDVSKTHFVGQCNPDDKNPWNDPALENTLNGDADSMPDGCDPCPFQTEKDPRGDFTAGDDDDYDGVPDRCDNCPPSYCTQQGLSTKYCFNPYPEKFGAQADWDKDGVGDICDSCPMDPVPPLPSASVDDADNDFAGAACDNCSKRNGLRACHTDAECSYLTADGKSKPGFCIAKGSFGQCDDDDGWACLKGTGNKDCRDGVLCGGTDFGRCSQQLDDVNDNGTGGPCDTCDGSPGETILANSNAIREKLELAVPLGDACDPVPLYSSRAVKEWNSAYDYKQRTRFISSAGSGRDPDKSYQTTSASLSAGLRWSNCRNEALPDPSDWNVPLEKCIEKYATLNPTIGYKPEPGQKSTWKRVSTATYPINATAFPGSGADQTYARTFSTVVSFDPFWHGKGENEQLRVGSLENLLWDHAADIASGAVDSYLVGGEVRSTGAFWSHVEDDQSTYASKRDQDYYETKGLTHGGLRDHYTHVITPIKPPVFTDFPIPFSKCKVLGNCNPYLRGDLIEFHLAPQTASGFSHVPAVGGLVFCPGGDCLGLTAMPPIPLKALVGAPVASAFNDSSRVFLSPVERPQQAWADPPSQMPLYVGAPRSWQPGAHLGTVTFDGAALSLGCRACDLGLAAAKSPAASEPSARDLPLYAYSARHRAVYMIGGRHPAGGSTREIWRHDLESASWTLLLEGGEGAGLSSAAPFDVRAAGFDPSRRQLAYVDFTEKPVGKWKKLPVARLVVFDVARRAGSVALVLPRVGIYERLDLVARGNATWVLVGQVKNTSVWHAFELELAADGSLKWTGHAAGLGAIIDAPFNTAGGVLLPVARKGKLELERLEASDLHSNPVACTTL